MAEIIPLQIKRWRLPRRLLNDGWWLKSPPHPPSRVIAFPKPHKREPSPKLDRTASHLTLVISRK